MQRAAAVESALLIGLLVNQITSIKVSSRSSACVSTMDSCLSRFCSSDHTFLHYICKDGGCQMKAAGRCNRTVQALLGHYPGLHGCLCAWEEEPPCASLTLLSTLCHPHTHAAQQQRNPLGNWQVNSVRDYDQGLKGLRPDLPGYERGGSCLQQMLLCVHDKVCNRQLVPLVQTCSARLCNSSLCSQATQAFYRGLEPRQAEGLGLCGCEPGDHACLGVKRTLHSGSCGGEEEAEKERICLENLDSCLRDSPCRAGLETLLSSCWSTEDRPCSDHSYDDCIFLLDPALFLSGAAECRTALLATVGTPLHQPCSCRGLYDHDLLKCNTLHQILHNQSHFMLHLSTINTPNQPAVVSESGEGYRWLSDQLLYVFVYVLLVVVVLSAVGIIVHKLGMHKGTEKQKFHSSHERGFVVNL